MRSAQGREGFVLLDSLLLLALCLLLVQLLLVSAQTMRGMEGMIVEDMEELLWLHDGGDARRVSNRDAVQFAVDDAVALDGACFGDTALSRTGSDGGFAASAVCGAV